MARVTVEDCIELVPNRFDLVILAAERTKRIASGVPLTIDRDNDKNPVIALREIAAGSIDIEALRDSQIASLQKNNRVDQIEEENLHVESQEEATESADYASDVEDDVFDQDSDLDAELDAEIDLDLPDDV